MRRIDQPSDSYVIDQLTSQMEQRARALWREVRETTGQSVYVHPVVVIWGRFPAGETAARCVSYVAGRQVAAWLSSRPVELDGERRECVANWLRKVPRERGRTSTSRLRRPKTP